MNFLLRLEEQLGLLKDYCDLYDQGKMGHALSIAARLDVIVTMLRSEEGGGFIREHDICLTSNVCPPNASARQIGHHPLAVLAVSATVGEGKVWAEFAPLLRTPEHIQCNKKMKVGAWLRETVLVAKDNHRLDRADLIRQMRNKDGGAHPYSEPEPNYKAVSSKLGLGLYAIGPSGVMEFNPPAHVATIRQIAHEVLSSLSIISGTQY